ncbi:hypothetical protein [Devosia sp.]|uniref:hypothetical protein n=1 Tax=Devosia sp. TaxID=1871048 RepID=UPI002FC93B20
MTDETALAFIKDEGIPIELKTMLLQDHLATQTARRERIETSEQRREEQRQKRLEFWHNTPLVVALVGVITIAANGAVSWVQSDQTADASALQAQRQFSYETITSELSKTDDQTERANVLLFLTKVGILQGLDLEALASIAQNTAETASVTIPSTIGQFSPPSYDEPIPTNIEGQTEAANILLRIAVEELNNDVDEFNQREAIDKYWSVVPDAGSLDEQSRLLWSAAFLSWAIVGAGNPDGLELSPAHYRMWQSALDKKMTILPPAKPLPGDLAFFARGTTGENARDDGVWLGIAGVVKEVGSDGMVIITGNTNEGLRLVDRRFDDVALVGYVRLGTSAP